jgi:hypothetical protein
MKLGLSQIHESTPAIIVKIGSTLITLSTVIAGYGLTQSDKIVGYIGLGCAILGTILISFTGDDKK